MRIRKGQALFPPSTSLSPLQLSDPHFTRSPVVQLPLHNDPLANSTLFYPPRPSDHSPTHPIGEPANGRDSSAYHNKQQLQQDCLIIKQGGEKLEEEEERGGDWKKSNDTRQKSFLGAEVGSGSSPQPSSFHQAGGRWCEGEKAFPLKKRRGSFERRMNDDTIMDEDNKTDAKMKTKMNKKCARKNDDEQEEREPKEAIHNSSAKKRGRGGALMEGSRCSRVNGRGWRCCQQTLVGYSLCEHHLGKGRLRSMTSVRSRSLGITEPKKDEPDPLSSTSSSSQDKQQKQILSNNVVAVGEIGAYEEDDDEKQPLMATKKKLRLGMVKARSMSSLLGQTDNAIAMSDNNN